MLFFIQLILPLLLIFLLLYLKRRYSWKLIKRYRSDISGNIDVSRKHNGELVLMTNYFVQGVSIEDPSIEKSYWYAVAAEILKQCAGKEDTSALFIGLGANTSSLIINKRNPDIQLTIVEIDPLIIRACREYFHLKNMKNTEVIPADIYALLKKHKKSWQKQYECIVIDTFDAQPPYLLKGSHDPVFLNQLLPWLTKTGMFIFNIPVKTTGIQVEALLDYLKEEFVNVDHRIVRDPRGYRNYVITAGNRKALQK